MCLLYTIYVYIFSCVNLSYMQVYSWGYEVCHGRLGIYIYIHIYIYVNICVHIYKKWETRSVVFIIYYIFLYSYLYTYSYVRTHIS